MTDKLQVTTWGGGKTITVSEVNQLFPQLGVPHFQRGRVWGSDSIGALLESLFYKTPCGSFVFWESGDNAENGVALAGPEANALKYLVIDGQQRIRSLHEAFTDAPLSADDDSIALEPGEGGRPKQWCVNLAKAPGFEGLVKSRAREFPLFVFTVNPKLASDRSPLRKNVLPLADLRRMSTWEAAAKYHDVLQFGDGISKEEGLRAAARFYPALHEGIRTIEQQEFFVALREDTHNLAEMAGLYNRINAGGKQVEVEERAFATLVGLQPKNASISDGLRRVFSVIHADGQKGMDRDALLKRQEERAFGFKLFVRVFLQVCQYHLGYRQGRSSFSFDLVGRDDFQAAFERLSSEDVGALWSETERVTQHVKSLLENELFCDDLRTLPDATGLMPVMQLLIQYPKLTQDVYRPLLAQLCLQVALAAADTRDVLRWVAEAGNPTQNALEVIPKLIEETNAMASARLGELDEANSIQSRYVLLLYWLERRLGARDFRYDLVSNPRKPLAPPELVLNRQARPEKQHLVPFSHASTIFGVDVRRTGSHPFNNIGNLTYISSQLNGLGALSDDFADLAGEYECDRANVAAHLLLGGDEKSALAPYKWLRERLDERNGSPTKHVQPKPERVVREFARLTAARRELIGAAFKDWLERLGADALRALSVESMDELSQAASAHHRIEPCAPRFPTDPHAAHVVRQLGLSNDIEDRVLALLRKVKASVVGQVPGQRAQARIHIPMTKKKHVWLEVQGNGVLLRLRHVKGPLRAGLFEELGLSDAGVSEQRLDPVPDLLVLRDYCARHEGEIARAATASKGKKQRGPDEPRPEIAELNYPQRVTELLNQLGGTNHGQPRQGADLSLRLSRTKSDGGKQQVLRVDLRRGGNALGFKFTGGLAERFGADLSDRATRVKKTAVWCDETTEKGMVEVLSWVAAQLRGDGA
ncbi:MAG: DUF262 domain-containing protein [Vicinamibacterales bacterium]